MIPDIDLINEVKEKNSSEALSELSNRHTGLYLNIVKRFSEYSHDKSIFQDVSDERIYNIYNWALKYDPSKNMKFSTYLGQMTKFMCKSLLTNEKKMPVFESVESLHDYSVSESPRLECEINEINSNIDQKMAKTPDSKFNKIAALRKEKLTWPEIGEKLGISHEWARQIYKQKMNKLQKYVKS